MYHIVYIDCFYFTLGSQNHGQNFKVALEVVLQPSAQTKKRLTAVERQ